MQQNFGWQVAHKLKPRRSTLGRHSPCPSAPEWWEATKRVFDKGTVHTKRVAIEKPSHEASAVQHTILSKRVASLSQGYLFFRIGSKEPCD